MKTTNKKGRYGAKLLQEESVRKHLCYSEVERSVFALAALGLIVEMRLLNVALMAP